MEYKTIENPEVEKRIDAACKQLVDEMEGLWYLGCVCLAVDDQEPIWFAEFQDHVIKGFWHSGFIKTDINGASPCDELIKMRVEGVRGLVRKERYKLVEKGA